MQKETDNWYASWFDTPYYHILYKDRDHTEAAQFMSTLTNYLNLNEDAEILDLACGKGRHARYLNTLGYDVTGVDLSESSIAYAKQYENNKLHFKVHDMCEPFNKQFDAVFNLFTSFGYFETEEDNLRTIKAIKADLKTNGHGVIDFLNSNQVLSNLVPSETKTVEGIDFKIERLIEDHYIVKNVAFSHNGKDHFYTERVKALTLDDFKNYFNDAGVTLDNCFGDYKLNAYDAETSERLILLFSK